MAKRYIFLFSIMFLGLLSLDGFYAFDLLGIHLKYTLMCILLLIAAYTLLFGYLRGVGRVQGSKSLMEQRLDDATEFVAVADKALYQAKHAGRSCVAFDSTEPEETVNTGGVGQGDGTEFLLAIEGYLSSLHTYDESTWDHSNRIAYYAIHLAKELGMSAEEREHVYMAALLHDVGKTSIPQSILNKSSCLTDEEFRLIQQHPLLGYEKLIRHDILKEKTQILMGVLHHHERWDGKGYPYRLRGEEIPLLARILTVVDAFDAMTSNRVYKKGLSVGEALREIQRNIGTQFDPQVAQMFIRICFSHEELFQSMGKARTV